MNNIVVDEQFKIENGTYEKKKTDPPVMEKSSGVTDHDAASSSLPTPHLSEVHPSDSEIIWMIGDFCTMMQSIIGNGSAPEVKSALKSCVDILEDICRNI